jgi:hypothetical protein
MGGLDILEDEDSGCKCRLVTPADVSDNGGGANGLRSM